jgi:hypothetical protein
MLKNLPNINEWIWIYNKKVLWDQPSPLPRTHDVEHEEWFNLASLHFTCLNWKYWPILRIPQANFISYTKIYSARAWAIELYTVLQKSVFVIANHLTQV